MQNVDVFLAQSEEDATAAGADWSACGASPGGREPEVRSQATGESHKFLIRLRRRCGARRSVHCWWRAARSKAKRRCCSTASARLSRAIRGHCCCWRRDIRSGLNRSRRCLGLRRSAGNGVPSGTGSNRIAGGVFLLDSIGELASLYQFADLAFVGGSLVPKGGHNVLEAAQFGIPILVGPSTENFRDIIGVFQKADALARGDAAVADSDGARASRG